jgi:DNA polymerase-3 subunit alpha
MLVGRVRQYGVHAGGFVIAADSLMGGRGAIVRRGKDMALPWDMKIAEELGFIKLDFLGLDALTAIKSIGSAINVDWPKVPLDDPEVMKDFADGLTAGVPQFQTPGLRNFVRKLKPEKFHDLVWATAAFRPGALGQLDPDKLAETYRRDPNDILVYQEDVMRICVELAGFSWTDATKVQKTMAKSQGVEAMGEWTDKFVEGCVKTINADPEAAAEYWLRLLSFGRYAFNKAHATAYAWNSYRIAWAKRKYPLETFLELLRVEENRQPLIDESRFFGVKILPPDPNLSGLDWEIEDGAIRMPLTMVDGLDLSLAKVIIEKRKEGGPFRDEEDFIERMVRKSSGKKKMRYKYPDHLPKLLFSRRMPEEFFEREVKNPKEILSKNDILSLLKKEASCVKCPFSRPDICKFGVVPIEFGTSNVMVVGDSPGSEESRKHRPFVGPSGRMLDDVLFKYGVNVKRLTFTNVSHCQPPHIDPGKNEPMTRAEAESYADSCPWLDEEMEILRPPLILAVGKRAWSRLVDPRGSIVKANGKVAAVRGVKIVGCIHPAFVMRDRNRMSDFEAAIKKFADLYKVLYPEDTPERRLPTDPDIAVRARAILGRS